MPAVIPPNKSPETFEKSNPNLFFTVVVLILGERLIVVGPIKWWFLLSGGAGLFRNKFKTRHLRWINRVSGLIIIGFGCFILAGLI